MLAGMWILVLLPLMDALSVSGWASSVPVPGVFGYGAVRTLDDTLVGYSGPYSPQNVYAPLVFCIGVVLLFSKERGRRRGQLDWTRRWGVLCSYVVLLLSAVQVLFISALVLAGIAAIFLYMPPKYQPGVTPLFVKMSTAYLRYGPYPKAISVVVLVAFSSIAILLACVPLFDALRSSGPKRLAAIFLAPLALFSLMHLAQVGRYCLYSLGITSSGVPPSEVTHYGVYFWPPLLVSPIGGVPKYLNVSGSTLGAFVVEAAKWSACLTIAMWLSVAQIMAWWRRGVVVPPNPSAE